MVARTQLVDERFALVRLLGSGGFAEVWLADDLREHKQVALKLPRGRRSSLAGEAPAPEREFDIAARLDHPNIVRVLASGTSDGEPYLVLEYVEGPSLREHLRDSGPLTISETRALAAELSSALAHAHGRGILHNDIKPENILLGPEGAKLTDFGAAAGVLSTIGLGQDAEFAATIAYLAPEVLQGERPTPRSDIYALGLVLYEAASGRLPWASGTASAVAGQRLAAPAVALDVFIPEAPGFLVAALTRAMALIPEERFASAEEFGLAVEGIQQTVPIARPSAAAAAVAVGPTSGKASAMPARNRPVPTGWPHPRRQRVPAWVPAAAMVGGGLAAVVGLGSLLSTGGAGFDPWGARSTATPDARLVASEPTPTPTTAPTEQPTARPTRILLIPNFPTFGDDDDDDDDKGRGSPRGPKDKKDD